MAGAAVVLFRGEEVLGEATTDANGSASVPIQETPCRLLVAPCCAPSKVVEVAAKSTAIEVTYDDGAIFSGHVTVDGAPPATPVELVLQAEAPLVPAVEIPDPVAMRLRTLRTAYSWQLAAKSDRDGAFAFFGLAPHVRFTVQIAAPYENAATGETWARFDEAQQDVELALHFNPSIHGRIVDTSGAPLPGWHVEGWAGSPDEWDSEAPVDSDARGDFRLFLHQSHHGGTTFARLYVCDPGGTSIRRVDIGQTVDRGFDVGDVVVDLRKIVTLVPRDANGLPLSLFAVVVEHATRAGELPCRPVRDVVDAAHARAGLVLADDVKTLRLLAPGCAAVDVPAVPANAPVEVVLPAAATLEFDVRDPDGKRPSGCTLELAGPKWPGAWSREELVAAHVALGGSPLPWEGERDRTAQSFRIGASKDGVFRALALLPELATTLVVRDSLGAEVLRDEVVLQAGETRKLERTLANDAVTLAGFVHDVDGTPLKKTRIEWRTGTAVQLVWTGEDGRFRVEGVRAPRVTLVFQASGHAWKWLRDLDVRAVPGELDVELKPGHSTRCGFVGANGASAATAVWIESVASRPFPDGADLPPEGADRCDGESEGDVGYGFAELPASELRLRARIDGFTFALSVERDCEVNYNTTVHGPVEIDWSVAATASNGRTLTALRLLPLERRGARATIPIGAAAAAAGSGLARIDKIAIDRYTVALVWSDAAGQLTEEKTDVVVDVSKQESARVTLTR
jgi:hypothetical protein